MQAGGRGKKAATVARNKAVTQQHPKAQQAREHPKVKKLAETFQKEFGAVIKFSMIHQCIDEIVARKQRTHISQQLDSIDVADLIELKKILPKMP